MASDIDPRHGDGRETSPSLREEDTCKPSATRKEHPKSPPVPPPLRAAKGDASAASRGMPEFHPNTPVAEVPQTTNNVSPLPRANPLPLPRGRLRGGPKVRARSAAGPTQTTNPLLHRKHPSITYHPKTLTNAQKRKKRNPSFFADIRAETLIAGFQSSRNDRFVEFATICVKPHLNCTSGPPTCQPRPNAQQLPHQATLYSSQSKISCRSRRNL